MNKVFIGGIKQYKKSKAASMVLRLMDMNDENDNPISYTKALNIVLNSDKRINKAKLEKELNRYI